jgi:hypothetical protein
VAMAVRIGQLYGHSRPERGHVISLVRRCKGQS